MAEPSRKKQRRHLNYDKCRCCRQAKKACTPIKRIWPQKCHRCTELELECSESTRAAGAPHLVPPQPVSQVVNATDTQEMYDLSLRVTWLRRLKLYQKTVDAAIEAQKILFGQCSHSRGSWLQQEFIRSEEASLFAHFLDEGTFSNPLAALVTLSFDTEVTSFRNHPLYPSCTPAPEAIVDRLRASGNIGTALVLQEIMLLDKRNKPNKEISAAEMQKYCETYTQTWERLKIITSAVSVLPPLHNLLLLTQGKVRFPLDLFQIRLQDYLGRSLLQLALDLGVAEDILRHIEFNINTTLPPGYLDQLPIHIACSGESEAVAKYFLDNNADLGVADVLGRSPLHYAAASGNEKIVQLLLRWGASIDCKDKNGFSPLAWATKWGHTAVVQVLGRKGANINTKDNNNNTPLFKAAGEGRTDIVQLLLKNGANVNSKNIYGYTPLFGPAAGGRADIVRLLLEKGANINSKDDYGNTPLSKAVKHGRIRIVQLLLEKGADLSTETTDVTLIQTAVVYGHMEIAEKLRAAARERYTLAGNPRLS